MARTPNDTMNGHMDSQIGEATGKTTVLQAQGEQNIDLPSIDFVVNSDMSRDGQDLILETPDGSVVVIEGYFSAMPAPVLTSPEGSALTPQLVESFVHHAGPVQYASNGLMTDESPVGAVQELTGHATVTRTDGTTEEISIGTPIFQGDIIETDGEGAVNIVFIDETSFAVSENAKLAIDEYVFDPSTESGTSNFSIIRGVFVFTSGLIGRDDPDDVTLDTPVGSIGIRGTTIAGNINPDGDSTITVVEGAIVVRNGSGESKTLSSQFETVTLSGYDSTLDNTGTMDSQAVHQDYGSLQPVSPNMFLAAADPIVQESAEGAEPTGDGAEGAADDPALTADGTQEPAPEEAPADDPILADGTQEPAPADDPALADGSTGDTNFDGSDTNFDGSDTNFDGSGTNTFDGGTTDPLAPPPPPPGDTTGGTTTTSSGTTTTTTSGGDTTTTAPPPPPPLDIVINHTIIDDNLDTSVADTVAVIETTFAFGDVQYSLLGVKINGVDASGAFTLIDGTDHRAVIKLTSNSDIFVDGDIVEFAVNATLPDGRTRTETFNLNVDDLLGFGVIQVTDIVAGSESVNTINENSAEDVFDVLAPIFGSDNVPAEGVTWSIAGALDASSNDWASSFSIDQNNPNTDLNTIRVSTSGLDREAVDGLITLQLQATLDSTGQVITKNVVLNVADIDDTTPALVANNGIAPADNLIEGGTIVLNTSMLDASDADSTDPDIVFTITAVSANGDVQIWNGSSWVTATVSNTFTMQDLINGNVRYVHDGTENFVDSFDFQLQDSAGNVLAGTNTFNISIVPANDAPSAGADDTATIGELDADSTAVYSLSANDPDGDALTYSIIGGDPNGAFAIDASGNITIADTTKIDYETQNTYNLTVKVDDGNGGIDTMALTVNVTDVTGETVSGSTGDDTITGGSGTDAIFGDTGNDILSGGDGDDTFTVTDGDGNDTINGGTTGETNGDTYYAFSTTNDFDYNLGTNNDGSVDDVTSGNTDTFTSLEKFLGGTGNDTFYINDDNTTYTVDGGGGGTDTLDFSSRTSSINFNMSPSNADISGGATIYFSNIENFVGSMGNDTFYMLDGDGNMTFDGANGSDIYDASSAVTSVTFNAGTNTVSIGGGDVDTVYNVEMFKGGSNDDIITATDSDGSQTYYGNGNTASGDTYDASAVTASLLLSFGTATVYVGDGTDTDNLIGVENITAGSATDDKADFASATAAIDIDLSANIINNDGISNTYNIYNVEEVAGSAYADTITGDSANNTLWGMDGNDIIDGDVGDDTLYGDNGNDTFITHGGDGSDTIDGGTGIDTYDASGSNNSLIDISGGMGNVLVTDTQVISTTDTVSNVENFIFGSAAFQVHELTAATATTYLDVDLSTNTAILGGDTFTVQYIKDITGSAYDDIMDGNAEDNTIYGGAGDDDMAGGAGNDTIYGEDGDDILIGEAGNDALDGGTTGETYGDWASYDSATGGVTINDITVGTDAGGDGHGTTDTFTSIENIDGSAHSDFVDASTDSGVNEVWGQDGDDILKAGDGDILEGNLGNDDLYYLGTGTADFEIYGGDGADNVYMSASGALQMTAANGAYQWLDGGNSGGDIDTIFFTGANINIDMDGSNQRIESFEVYDFANAGADTINIGFHNFMVQYNEGSLLTIKIDDSDDINLGLDGWGYSLTGGDEDMTAGANYAEYTDGSGHTIRIEYTVNAGATGSITVTGGPLDLANAIPGADGYRINGATSSGEKLGNSVAAIGDIDGDGFENWGAMGISTDYYGDSVIDSTGNISFSGSTGRISIDGVGDFDGDGSLDYIAGNDLADNMSATSGTGNIALFTTSQVFGLSGLTAGDLAGSDVAGIGDINGDGYNEIAFGAAGADINGTDSGSIYLVDYTTINATGDIDVTTEATKIDGTAVGDQYGSSVASAGDFNNDGFADFIVGAPGAGGGNTGYIDIYLGGTGGATLWSSITGIGVEAGGNDVPIFSLGDITGDGVTDVAYADTLNDQINILVGGSGADNVKDIWVTGGTIGGQAHTIEGGGSAGDFNGDGIDDIAIALKDGTDAKVFVLYGGGLSGSITLDDTFVTNTNNGFLMDYSGAGGGSFDFEFAGADTNGDGFDDLIIGTADANGGDGAITVIYGRDSGNVTQGTNVTASGTSEHLVGSAGIDTLDDGGLTGITMNGGAGGDTLVIGSNTPGDIDAGTGYDVLQFTGTGTLDFSSVGSEALSGVEKFDLKADGQTLILGLDDIFRLMQESDNNTLKISDTSGGTTSFIIDDNNTLSGAQDVTNMASLGFSDGGVSGGYQAWNFGSYQLLVDTTNIDTTSIV